MSKLQKILVIEASGFYREMYRQIFGNHFRILESDNSEKGVKLFRANPEIVCIWLDLSMGLETLQKIRQISATVPIVLTIGDSDFLPQKIQQASLCLKVPFLMHDLVAIVEGVRPNSF